jgi:ParB family chromosome partitioning protein
LREIPLAKIRPNRFQPRKSFDEESLSSLVDSIRAVGILQPVLVRATEGDDFELIAGERRCRAARRAGLQTVPALVQQADDSASLEQALVENLHREDLNPIDEAAAYQQLIEDFGLTHEDVARRVGKSRAAVTNSLRLFQLAPSIQRYVRDGQLSAGHARALLMTPDRELQDELVRVTLAESLSVRALEDRVRRAGMEAPDVDAPEPLEPLDPITAPEPTSVPRATVSKGARNASAVELEQLLSDHLNTRVRVELHAAHGRVVVDFADLDDLERIYRAMVGRPTV